MKVYGIMPSRFGSSRFPGKPLAILAGKPLIAWVVEAVKKAKSLDEVFVATDDERIVKAVEEYGGKAVMTPSELPSGTDRIACAATRFIQLSVDTHSLSLAPCPPDFADDDILVNIQGDEPLIDPQLIDNLVEKLKSGDYQMATAVTPIKNLQDYEAKSVVKVVLAKDDSALYFSRAPIPCNRDTVPDFDSTSDSASDSTSASTSTSTSLYVRHLGIYAYRGGFLKRYIAEPQCELEKTEKLEQLRALYMGAKIAVVRTEDEGVGVDTPEDAERVAKLLECRQTR